MAYIGKILAVVIISIGGYLSLLIMGFLADYLGYIPKIVPVEEIEVFYRALFGLGTSFLIVLSLVSLSSLFVKNEYRKWLLFAPLYGTILYGAGVMVYFTVT